MAVRDSRSKRNMNKISLHYIGCFLTLLLHVGYVAPSLGQPVDLGSQRELFVDDHLVEHTDNVVFRLHEPVQQPRGPAPLPMNRHYMTILKDEDEQGVLFRAYWRGKDARYTGEPHSGNSGEVTRYAESRDGHVWDFPDLGQDAFTGEERGNVVLANSPPFSHNFSPFIDTRPGVPPNEKYKALAGYPGAGKKSHLVGAELIGRGLHAFVSPDGLNWTMTGEVIPYEAGWRHAFDSQNTAFWSPAEQLYVCYFRSWTPDENLRAIRRTTSPDFIHWSKSVPMYQNEPGEHLYTNQTHPYFRAPQIYIALPTRYVAGRLGDAATGDAMLGSTDILFMSTRAGTEFYSRMFKHAYMRPGIDPDRWENRANYVALNVVQTGKHEMSIYHRSGHRYTLRLDGFVSAHAGYKPGELITKPITFSGNSLELNFSTSAAGSLKVELLDESGKAIPNFSLSDSPLLVGDAIERRMEWKADLANLQGKTVKLRFVMQECDLYAYRFH